MVSFESSLRLSRRRGWEDAYLDYQSLHLLLTQIEAVYEEEDWKRGAGGGSGNNNNNDSFAQLPNNNFDESDEDNVHGVLVNSDHANTNGDGFLKKCWKNTVRLPGSCTTNTTSRRTSSSTSGIRRNRLRAPRSSSDGFNEIGNADNIWISNDYFDYSADQYHRNKKHGGKDSTSHDRALDKGGWRSPGVTDYRDELFLVSDEDIAYGNFVDGQSEEEDDDDEDDNDDWTDDDEASLSEEFDEIDNFSNADHDADDLGSNRISPLPAFDEVKSVTNNLTPLNGVTDINNCKMNDLTRSRNYESPPARDHDDSVFDSSKRVHQWTPVTSPTTSPINEKTKLGQQKVKFSDSPGVLEAGYETFAAAAVRSGFVHMGGDESHMMTVGSPTEQRGWIPNWLGGKGERKPKPPTETDSLLLKRKQSQVVQGFGQSAAVKEASNQIPIPPQNNQSTSQTAPKPKEVDSWLNISVNRMAYMTGELKTPKTNVADKPFKLIPVPATAAGGLMPETPTESPSTPPFAFIASSEKHQEQKKSGVGFGVSLNMIPTTEFLHPSTSNRKSQEDANLGMSQFYSFQNEDDNYLATNYETEVSQSCPNDLGTIEECDGGDEHELGTSNMISFYSYSGGNDDGYLSVRSPTPVARRHNPAQQRLLSSSEKRSISDGSSGGGIMGFLFGSGNTTSSDENKRAVPTEGRRSTHKRGGTVRASSTDNAKNQRRWDAKHGEAVVAGKRKRARLRKKQQLRRQRERVPIHLRLAHARAAIITERFRGLLRAEVEKVILFTNSRLGELSDTIGSLRYSSNEDGQEEVRRKSPSLGMHHLSSSDSEDGDSGQSSVSSLEDEQEDALGNRGIDSSETKKQLMMRDRLRISKPLFQKADFLGEDYSLLSAVDEVDAYTAVGVELLHLLKYICVNVVAVRKICKKHDNLLSNRMLGGYYRRLASERKEISNGKQRHRDVEPQSGGYIVGIYDTKIQHIANSTTMETVSSSLAIALTDFEASQSRSALLGLGFSLKGKGKGSSKAMAKKPELSPPSHQTSMRSRFKDATMNRFSGQCLRGDDGSTFASQDGEKSCTNTPITRLQFVVSSIFGLREAARLKSIPFEHFSSRLFMISTGHSVTDDGLEGCSRETLNFLHSYQPDVVYSLDLERFYNFLKVLGANDIGGVMVASLAAASKGYSFAASKRSRFRRNVAASMSINPLCTWGENGAPVDQNSKFQSILRLNRASIILYLANYYCIVPTAHLIAKSLHSKCFTALLIGAANFSSILGLGLQSLLVSKRNSFRRRRMDIAEFRLPIGICSLVAMVGNILFSYSLKKSSLGMAFVGRLLIGFGSSEFLNRQLLFKILEQESINAEVARLATMSMIIIPISIVLGSFAGFETFMVPVPPESRQSTLPSSAPFGSNTTQYRLAPPFFPFDQRGLISLESIGYIMAFFWCAHLIGMIFFFELPEPLRKMMRESTKPDELQYLTAQEEDFDSDNEDRDSPQQLESIPFISAEIGHGDGTFEKLQAMSRKNVKHNDQLSYSECIANVRQLMFSNVAFPTTVAILFIVKMTIEIMISSCGTIASRYFNWSATRSGIFMGLIASAIFPVNLALSSVRNLPERFFMKTTLRLARLGLILMVNYESIIIFVMSTCSGSQKKVSSTRYYYDEIIGISQYLSSFAVIYLSMVALESVTLTLMSKVQHSPRQIKKFAIDASFVVILESAMARGLGDIIIYAFDVSVHDIINCLAVSLMIAFSAGIYVVRKHYFFLR